jgi:hypothetical protein
VGVRPVAGVGQHRLGGDDDLVLGRDGPGVVGGQEGAALLHPAGVGVGRIERSVGSRRRFVSGRRSHPPALFTSWDELLSTIL